jgi:uncharacterized protein with PQ loop repeat
MKLELMDTNVSYSMNIFIIIANIINITYNIPQMVRTYKRKTTQDLSSWFLFLRVIASIIWVFYAIEVDSMLMLTNTLVTIVASIFIGYYKVIEIVKEYRNKNDELNVYEIIDMRESVADRESLGLKTT